MRPEQKAAEEIADVFDTWGIRTVAEAESQDIIRRANAEHYGPMLRDGLSELEQTLADVGSCDHDVGLCVCGLRGLIQDYKDELAAMEGEGNANDRD